MEKELFNHLSRYAITFGQVSIIHIGSQQHGVIAQKGFTVDDLTLLKNRLSSMNPPIQSTLFNLSQKLPQELRKQNQAATLLIPNFAKYLIGQDNAADMLYEEQQSIDYDQKYYDFKKKQTLNKRARHNVIFGQEKRQASEDYKEYSIKAFNQLKLLNLVRNRLAQYFQVDKKLSKDYLQKLNAQGNKYYNKESGIGFHGDSERKIVICLSLGKQSTLRYCWRKPHSSSNNDYECTDINVKHGDVYIMSEKATGNDWRKRSRYRVVHAAGSQKYINS